MKIAAIVASRMTSTRLPGKILKEMAGKPALVHLIDRLKKSKYLQEIVIATTVNATDDLVVETAKKEGAQYYRGSEMDVLARTVEAAESVQAEYIVEITSDCPLADAAVVDRVIEYMLEHPYCDYVSNDLVRTYPLGLDVEIFRTRDLRVIEQNVQIPEVREHVSLYFYTHPEQYYLANIEAPFFLHHPEYRLTLDTEEDYRLIRLIYESLYPKNINFDSYDIVRLLMNHPEYRDINQMIQQKKVKYHGE